jgi:hydroxyethylthiazole kinase-like uncharacterized protein yjeF
MREIDRLTTERYALPSLLLMETAANAAARAIVSNAPQELSEFRALILCGRGNNGGDGAALARALWTMGAARIEVVLFGRVDEMNGDARVNFEIIQKLAEETVGTRGVCCLAFDECADGDNWAGKFDATPLPHVVVDALFGTGLTRPLEGFFRDVVSRLSLLRESHAAQGESRTLVVSLDIPSGLDADSAEPIGEAARADLTVTFTAPKPANVLPPASHFNGQLVVADIGTPAALVEESPSQLFLVEADDARAWLRQTRYAPDSFKNTHGHALVVAGSREMSGAAVLCAEAAMRSGAGLVTVATPASALAAVAARVMPEVMTAQLPETGGGAASAEAFARVSELSERADVIAIGSGLTSDDDSTRRLVRAVVEQRTLPIVIDADGLNALAPWSSALRGTAELPLVLTPHPGEMRRLIGVDDKDALKDRVRVAREFATAHELILVLKGSRTITAAPDGRVFVNPTGNAGLGTAGAGDTLTGIIAGFIAQARGALKDQADILSAVVAAVYVGGLAGDIAARERGMRTMVASDIREHLGAAVRALDAAGEQP